MLLAVGQASLCAGVNQSGAILLRGCDALGPRFRLSTVAAGIALMDGLLVPCKALVELRRQGSTAAR
eukprot:15008495-Alexandrium_andersonii.AAC.1